MSISVLLFSMSTYALPQNFIVTPSYRLFSGETRNYVISISDHTLQISSVKDPSHLTDATFISDVWLDFNPAHIFLEPIPEESPQNKIDPHQNLIFVSDTGESHTLLLRDILAQAFQNRDKKIEEERTQRKEEHQKALQEYESSQHYALAKAYNIADGFLKGFIPFDDDLIAQAINYYILGTTPQKMVLEDLKSRNLLGEFSPEDAKYFKSFAHANKVASAVGLTAIVALPLIIKGRQMYQATQAARQATTPFATIKSPQAWVATYFDSDKLRRSLVFMGVTNLAWLAGDLVITPLVQKEWNGWGQVAYDGGFINTLTGAILLIVSSKTSLAKKGILMVIATDIVSPPFQSLQNTINKNPDKPYDPIQATWDKLYLTLYCIPKGTIAMGIQKRWERQWMTKGFTEEQAAARVQLPVAIANEAAGNIPYTILVKPGKKILRDHLTPMIEADQFNLEKFLDEVEIEEVIILEPH